MSLAGGAGGQKETKTADGKAIPKQDQKWGDTTPNYSPGLPQYSSDHDSSTTYATLSDGNITIGGQTTSAQALGIHQDIGTANAQVNTLPNLQAILDKQKTVADATSTISSAARTFSQNQQATA